MGTINLETADQAGRLCLWALRYAVRRWPALLAVGAGLFLKIGLDVLRPWPMKVVVDQVLGGRPVPPWLARVAAGMGGIADREGLLALCVGATVVLFLAGWAVGVLAAAAGMNFGQRLVYDLGADLYGHLQRLSLRFHSRNPVGDSIRRVTTDCGCVSTIVNDALLPAVSSVVSLAVMFGIMWRLDPTLTLLSLGVVPFMAGTFRRYAGPMLERSYEQQTAEGKMYDVVEQTLSAVHVVQVFGGERRAVRDFRRSCRAAVRAALACADAQLRFKAVMGLATALGTAAVLGVGTSHVLQGRLTAGGVLVFLAYLASFYGPLEGLMYTSCTIQGAAGSARRVLEVLGSGPEVADAPGAAEPGALRGHVRLEGVGFGYQPNRPVLRGVTLEARPGQTVAVVGATGAGKTTLVSLVPRLFDPWAGRVLLDGRDARTLRLAGLRRQVGLVPQEPFLFPVSVAANIAYGRPAAPREAVVAAARAANAHEFIERLPDGYDTVLGERGATLSGGERQRLSITRAFLIDPPILILDEPTSALDAETERLLVEALRRLMSGRTTFIVAHRLSMVRDADAIFVLDGGQVVEQGTHAELLAAGGAYARYYALQFGEAEQSEVHS